MRYFLILSLFLSFPLFSSYGKRFSEVCKTSGSTTSGGGVVTTRTGGAVTTRSYTPGRRTYTKPTKIDQSQGTSKKRLKSVKVQTPPTEEEETLTGSRSILREQARTYRQEGYKLQKMGDLKGALVYYQKANQIDPRYVEAYNDIGVIYERQGDDEAALKMYKKALEVGPHYLPSYTNLALLYEKREDIANATYYWQKRYELGEEGEYWHEVARQHLLKLGTYPQVKKEMLEKKAIMLSQEMTEKREEEKFKSIEEARMHYDLGYDLVMKGDYAGALKELETALSLNPPDEELKTSIRELYRSTEKLYVKQQALHNTEDALGYIKNEDFISAGEKLKNALTEVFRIAQEK